MRKLWSHPSEKLPQPPNRDDVYSTFDKAIPTTVVNSIILLLWLRSFDICGGRLNTLPDRFVQSVVSTISFSFFRRANTGSPLARVFFFCVWQITMFISRKHDKKRCGLDTPSHRKSLSSPSVYRHQSSFLPIYTFPSRVEREISISMVNNVQDAMTMDPIDDDFSFMDNTVSGKTRIVYTLSRTTNLIWSSRRFPNTFLLTHHKPVLRRG